MVVGIPGYGFFLGGELFDPIWGKISPVDYSNIW